MDGIGLSGRMESRQNPAKGPKESQKAACEQFFLRFAWSRGLGQGHLADFFLKAAAQVPGSNSLEFFEREIRHAEHLYSWRIPRVGKDTVFATQSTERPRKKQKSEIGCPRILQNPVQITDVLITII
jgi:hypothetical protein